MTIEVILEMTQEDFESLNKDSIDNGISTKNDGDGFSIYDEDFNCEIKVFKIVNGYYWETWWSPFRYELYFDGNICHLKYEGAWKGFLSQGLIPNGIKGKEIYLKEFESSLHSGTSTEEFNEYLQKREKLSLLRGDNYPEKYKALPSYWKDWS